MRERQRERDRERERQRERERSKEEKRERVRGRIINILEQKERRKKGKSCEERSSSKRT